MITNYAEWLEELQKQKHTLEPNQEYTLGRFQLLLAYTLHNTEQSIII